MANLAAAFAAAVLLASAPAWGQDASAPDLQETAVEEEEEDDEFGADWPRTPGWEETGYLCYVCHSLAIVKQQGLSREDWDELLDWMVEEQGMPEPEPDERTLILDYLAQNFGVPEGAAGSGMP